MFCSNCGTQLSDNARFCHNCGSQIAPIPMQPMAPQGAPTQMQPMAPQGAPAQMQPMAPQGAPTQMQPMAPQGAPAPMQPMAPQGAPAQMQPMAPQGAPAPMQPMAPQGAPMPMYAPMNAPASAEMLSTPVQPAVPANAETPESDFLNNGEYCENNSGGKDVVKKKRSVVPVILIVLAMVIVISVAVMIILNRIKSEEVIKYPIYATVTDDNSYIFYGNGKEIVLDGDIEFAFLTADQKKIVVLEKKGDLYWTDVKFSEKTVIKSYVEGKEIFVDPDDFYYGRFLVYEVEDKNGDVDIYRYDFSNDEAVMVFNGKIDYSDVAYSYQYSKDISFAQAYSGNIRVLGPDADSFINVAQYDKTYDISLCGVSSDGQTLGWVLEKDDERTLYVYYNGNAEKVLDNVESQYLDIKFAPDNSCFIINDGSKVLFYRNGDEECTTVSFLSKVSSVYSENGLEIPWDVQTDAQGFFVVVYSGMQGELYYVEYEDGVKHKLLSKTLDMQIYDGRVVYIDKSEILYTAEIDLGKCELKEPQRIGSNIYNYGAAKQNSDYIFYLKEPNNNNEYDLYVYDIKKEDAVKIADEVRDVEIATDGRTVFYITDSSYDSTNHVRYGTLNVYDAKKNESHKIVSDVIVNSLTSGLTDGVDADSVFFEIYEGTSTDGELFGICYYDGKDYENLVSGLDG